MRNRGWCVSSSSSSSPTGIAESFFSGAVLLIVCARVLARLLAAVSCSVTFARQDNSALLIHRRIDQHPLEEHLIEQLLQVRWGSLVEAVAVLEEVKGLGEVLADFGGGGG